MPLNDDIRKKIDALFAKTVANGATPAEAIVAAEKAWELQRKYNVDLNAPSTTVNAIFEEYKTVTGWYCRFAMSIEFAIAEFCEARALNFYDGKGEAPASVEIGIVGYRSDIDFAFDLLDRLYAQMVSAGLNFFARTLPSDTADIQSLVLWCHQRRSRFTPWEREFLDDMIGCMRFSPKQEAKIRQIAEAITKHKRDDAAAIDFMLGWVEEARNMLRAAINSRSLSVQQAETLERKRQAIHDHLENLYPGISERKKSIRHKVNNKAMFKIGVEEGSKAGFGKPISRGDKDAPRLLSFSPSHADGPFGLPPLPRHRMR